MGFNKVYNALLEVFPEVDSRVLRAVAVEHSKDADAAVEVVLTEVIPFFTDRSRPPSSTSNKSGVKLSPVEASQSGETQVAILMKATDLDEKQDVSPIYDGIDEHHEDADLLVYERFPRAETVPSEKSQESNIFSASCQLSDMGEGINHANIPLDASAEGVDESSGCDIITGDKDGKGEKLIAQEKLLSSESSGELVVVPDMLTTDPKYLEVDASFNAEFEKGTINEMDVQDDSLLNTMVTRSGQICSVELLEGIIADARNNKKTLFSAMESVISLMKQLELQEKAAEQAKEEAAKGGLDILSAVENLKTMLQHEKEANDMHAGEVYGERAILATEVRELQSRLLSLSEERNKSLAVLDEMHETLVSRLSAAEEEEKVAGKEKLEKEELACRSLAEQELIMEKVVQESNMLKQEAEENAKLREFLVDRGLVVDVLQGEISVICQDVRFLKEKFDERVPFSKSLSSSQTSCILASSGSSLKSMALDQADEVPDKSENLQNLNVAPAIKEQQSSAEQPARDDKKALAEEGWEICENGDYM